MAVGLLLTRLVVLLPVLILHRILLRFRLGLAAQLAARSKVAVVLFEAKVVEVLVPKEVMLGRVQIPVGIWIFGVIPQMHFRALS